LIFEKDHRKINEVIKGIDMVRRQRDKIIKHYVKNHKYGFILSDEEVILNKANKDGELVNDEAAEVQNRVLKPREKGQWRLTWL
jgi:hypothetical protein